MIREKGGWETGERSCETGYRGRETKGTKIRDRELETWNRNVRQRTGKKEHNQKRRI